MQRLQSLQDRDPRQGQSPLFGNHVTLQGDKEGIIRVGQTVKLITS